MLTAQGFLDHWPHDRDVLGFGGSVYAGTIQPRSADSCQEPSNSS